MYVLIVLVVLSAGPETFASYHADRKACEAALPDAIAAVAKADKATPNTLKAYTIVCSPLARPERERV